MPEHFAYFHTFSQMGGLREARASSAVPKPCKPCSNRSTPPCSAVKKAPLPRQPTPQRQSDPARALRPALTNTQESIQCP
jgi:hypothetical protein